MKINEKKSQSEVGNRIERLYKTLKFTQTQFAKKIGIRQQSLSEIKKTGNISKKTLKKINAIYPDSTEWLLYGTKPAPAPISDEQQGIPAGMLPVIGWDQVTRWLAGEEDALDTTNWIYVESPNRANPRLFGLRIKSDSMCGESKGFDEGVIIIADPDREPLHGQYVIAIKEDAKEPIFRQYIREGDDVFLKALNPKYDLITSDKKYTICAVVMKRERESVMLV